MGLVVGAALVGLFMFAILFFVIEYKRHPEWLDEEDDIIDIDID